MKLGTSQRGTTVPALVAVMVLASVGVSLAGRPERTSHLKPSPSVTHAQPGRSGHQGVAPTETDTSPSPDPAADVSQACASALDAGNDALAKETGLAHAIEVVSVNCAEEPQAQGLLNALEHLLANQERQAANDHGGRPNEGANAAGTDADAIPPGHAKGTHEPGGKGQDAEHANEHASASTHP